MGSQCDAAGNKKLVEAINALEMARRKEEEGTCQPSYILSALMLGEDKTAHVPSSQFQTLGN